MPTILQAKIPSDSPTSSHHMIIQYRERPFYPPHPFSREELETPPPPLTKHKRRCSSSLNNGRIVDKPTAVLNIRKHLPIHTFMNETNGHK